MRRAAHLNKRANVRRKYFTIALRADDQAREFMTSSAAEDSTDSERSNSSADNLRRPGDIFVTHNIKRKIFKLYSLIQ
jgi:hypothetical protein